MTREEGVQNIDILSDILLNGPLEKSKKMGITRGVILSVKCDFNYQNSFSNSNCK